MLSVTGNDSVARPPVPSLTLAAPMARVGRASSSAITPLAVASLRVAFTGLLKLRVTVSSASFPASPAIATVTVLLRSPAAKVRVPPAMAV